MESRYWYVEGVKRMKLFNVWNVFSKTRGGGGGKILLVCMETEEFRSKLFHATELWV